MTALAQGTGYAVLALGYIASAAGKPMLVRDIAAGCQLPAAYLSKVVNRLARAGLVRTQRGINGGVTLARDATGISLLEVCEALDDPVLEQRCMLGIAECSDERACPAHRFNVETRERTLEFLRSMSIADVAAFETQRRWGLLSQLRHPGPGDGSRGNGAHRGNGDAGGDEHLPGRRADAVPSRDALGSD